MARIEKRRTEEGMVVTRWLLGGEVEVLRRDDLRGCYEVEGVVYGSLKDALDAAEASLEDPHPHVESETTEAVTG